MMNKGILDVVIKSRAIYMAVVGLALVAIVVACPGVCDAQESGSDEKKPTLKLGDRAPKIAIKDWVKGEPVQVGDGKNWVLVEFWATWCPPCRKSIPHLTKVQKQLSDKGLKIVGITGEDLRTVDKFVTKMGREMEYSVGLDDKNKSAKAYMSAFGIGGIPHAFLVSEKGILVWHGHPQELTASDLLKKMKKKDVVAKKK